MDTTRVTNPKRIMDRAIARRVFGLTVVEADGAYDDFAITTDPKSGKESHPPIKRYSSDIPAAMRVVEWMQYNGTEVSITWHVDAGAWGCKWRDNDGYTVHGTDPSFPMAICKCAIAAIDAHDAWNDTSEGGR